MEKSYPRQISVENQRIKNKKVDNYQVIKRLSIRLSTTYPHYGDKLCKLYFLISNYQAATVPSVRDSVAPVNTPFSSFHII